MRADREEVAEMIARYAKDLHDLQWWLAHRYPDQDMGIELRSIDYMAGEIRELLRMLDHEPTRRKA